MKNPVNLFEIGAEHIFDYLHVFYSFRVLHVTKFTIIDEENIPSFQECSVMIWQNKFSLIFKNSSVTVPTVIQVPMKSKGSEFFPYLFIRL